MGAGFPPSCMRFIRKDMVDLLLAARPELDIFEATAAGHSERVAELLHRDPTVARSWSADGFTALHFAAFFGQEAIAILLLQHSADASAEARNPIMKIYARPSSVIRVSLRLSAIRLTRLRTRTYPPNVSPASPRKMGAASQKLP
jgi:hypothetical protein